MKISILTSCAFTSYLAKPPIKQLLPLLLPVVNGFLESTTTYNRWLSLTMTSRAGTTADDATMNSLIETRDMNHNDDKSRSLRRQIPYVETFEDQIARELWETNPFDGAKYVVDTVIRSDISSNRNRNNNNIDHRCDEKIERNTKNLHPGILTPKTSSSPLLLSGYENLFDPLINEKVEEITIMKNIPTTATRSFQNRLLQLILLLSRSTIAKTTTK